MGNQQTPLEYLTELKQRYPRKSVYRDNLTALAESFSGGGRLGEEEILARVQTDYAERLLKRLSPRLQGRFDALLSEGYLAVGEVNDPLPNAHIVALGSLGFAIVFNSGLRDFIYRVTRALATRISVSQEDTTHEPLNFHESCQIIGDVFLWFKETGRACGPSYPVTRWQMILASELATEAELFFLAHEFGHLTCRIANRFSAKDEPHMQTEDSAWEEEFQADRFALYVLLHPSGDEYPLAEQPICYAGAELGLLIYAGLELLGVEFQATHPPATERIERLRSAVTTSIPDEESLKYLTNLSTCVDALFEEILKFIASDSYESFLDRASASTMAQLDSLLESCSGGVVPDYLTFASQASSLFNHGYSHKLHARMVQAAADLSANLERVSREGGAGAKSDVWVAFQKYKLLMHSVMSMREPAKSIFEEALGLTQ